MNINEIRSFLPENRQKEDSLVYQLESIRNDIYSCQLDKAESKLNDIKNAIQSIHNIRESNRINALYQYIKGFFYTRIGKWKEADECASECIKIASPLKESATARGITVDAYGLKVQLYTHLAMSYGVSAYSIRCLAEAFIANATSFELIKELMKDANRPVTDFINPIGKNDLMQNSIKLMQHIKNVHIFNEDHLIDWSNNVKAIISILSIYKRKIKDFDKKITNIQACANQGNHLVCENLIDILSSLQLVEESNSNQEDVKKCIEEILNCLFRMIDSKKFFQKFKLIKINFERIKGESKKKLSSGRGHYSTYLIDLVSVIDKFCHEILHEIDSGSLKISDRKVQIKDERGLQEVRAQYLFENKKFEEALQIYNWLLDQYQDFDNEWKKGIWHSRKGTIFLLLQDMEQAEESLRECIQHFELLVKQVFTEDWQISLFEEISCNYKFLESIYWRKPQGSDIQKENILELTEKGRATILKAAIQKRNASIILENITVQEIKQLAAEHKCSFIFYSLGNKDSINIWTISKEEVKFSQEQFDFESIKHFKKATTENQIEIPSSFKKINEELQNLNTLYGIEKTTRNEPRDILKEFDELISKLKELHLVQYDRLQDVREIVDNLFKNLHQDIKIPIKTDNLKKIKDKEVGRGSLNNDVNILIEWCELLKQSYEDQIKMYSINSNIMYKQLSMWYEKLIPPEVQTLVNDYSGPLSKISAPINGLFQKKSLDAPDAKSRSDFSFNIPFIRNRMEDDAIGGLFDDIGEDDSLGILAQEEFSEEEVPNLVFIPEGPLYDIPYMALFKDFKDGFARLLISKYAITVAPSLQIFKLKSESQALNKDTSSPYKTLIMANPTGDLYKTEKESAAIKNHMEGSIEVKPAIKHKVEAAIHRKGFDFIHFSGHGTDKVAQKPDSVFNGALILSEELGVQMPKDTKLYSEEILQLDLAQVRQVFLSACCTANGNKYQEGNIGLNWAFLAAGARSIVSTLWPLPDSDLTVSIVEEVYRQLNIKKKTNSQILQSAIKKQLEKMQKIEESEILKTINQWGLFTISGGI